MFYDEDTDYMTYEPIGKGRNSYRKFRPGKSKHKGSKAQRIQRIQERQAKQQVQEQEEVTA